MAQTCMASPLIKKNAFMKKKITLLIVLIQMTILGVAQTPKDSCSIPKDSLCQKRIAKSDTVNCPLDKLFLLKANVTNKEESKRNLPKIALPKNDIYREKFMNLQLINIIGSHLSRWKSCAEHSFSAFGLMVYDKEKKMKRIIMCWKYLRWKFINE